MGYYSISDEYLFVRYMGPKFVIVFSGIDSESVTGFIQELKTEIEKMEIEVVGENEINNKKKNSKKDFVTPKLNFVVTTYYKGTALEGLNKKLEEYLNEADKDESDINLI